MVTTSATSEVPTTRLQDEQRMTGTLISYVYPPHSMIVPAAVTLLSASARRWSGVILTLGGTLIAVMITEVILKPLIGRLRYGHLTFSSGHTTAVAAIAIAILLARSDPVASRCG